MALAFLPSLSLGVGREGSSNHENPTHTQEFSPCSCSPTIIKTSTTHPSLHSSYPRTTQVPALLSPENPILWKTSPFSLLVCVWCHQSQHSNKFWVAVGLIPSSVGQPQNKTVLFIRASGNMKCLGVHLAKYVQDLYNENQKNPLIEIKDNLNK